ncbi:MAG: TIGR00296 family protein [Thaumarchaeota archaeon]|nr:TIGR00296 family protein [Nitrososphaerota archaeon]
MQRRLSMDEGRAAVDLARASLVHRVRGTSPAPRSWEQGPFSELRGAFVTFYTGSRAPDGLRGCIGFPYPVKKLGDAIVEAALAAASEDPRFPPITAAELDSVVVEVSILTPPQELEPEMRTDLPSLVRIGIDGLIISSRGASGLLLPQVATDFGMGPQEFLSQACIKAGLPPEAWLAEGTEVQVYQAEIFGEETPGGSVRADTRES